MGNRDDNKAGDTKKTSEEYVKRETGKQDVPHVPAEKTGQTSMSCDDLEHPEQSAEDAAAADEESPSKIDEVGETEEEGEK